MAAKKPVTEAPAPESREAKAPNQFSSSIEFAMSVINDPNADTADKIRLAIALMPFQAPKLAEKKADDGKGGKRSVSSKFAPPPPPGSKPQLAVSND
ncbi:MAG: hypothetical protein KAY22_20185 [Rhizorhabdus sp.]|uniref:hypothetical protein n=1 Tax=Rhizorhabdus sp. TaxID=1968843 RepID=UPI001B4C64CC|nr:hypothetical protein [Rhizorhabdus sp.]MBP8234618.1 hypothetical protein [Rhizorhabdus sp.]